MIKVIDIFLCIIGTYIYKQNSLSKIQQPKLHFKFFMDSLLDVYRLFVFVDGRDAAIL